MLQNHGLPLLIVTPLGEQWNSSSSKESCPISWRRSLCAPRHGFHEAKPSAKQAKDSHPQGTWPELFSHYPYSYSPGRSPGPRTVLPQPLEKGLVASHSPTPAWLWESAVKASRILSCPVAQGPSPKQTQDTILTHITAYLMFYNTRDRTQSCQHDRNTYYQLNYIHRQDCIFRR